MAGHTTNKKKDLKYKIITIFILPPSREELFERLLKREQNDEKITKERMKQFKKDVLHWKNYDFVVINDNIQRCYNRIIDFIDKKKRGDVVFNYNKNQIKQHIELLLK